MPAAPALPTVLVDGHGPLAEEIARALRRGVAATVREGSLSAEHLMNLGSDAAAADWPDVAVLVRRGPTSWTDSAWWQHHGVPHVLVAHQSRAAYEIGPLVVPGVSACAVCLARHTGRSDAAAPTGPGRVVDGPLAHALPHHGPLPLLAAALVAVTVDDHLTGGNALTGVLTSLRSDPVSLAHHYVAPHPECGCRLGGPGPHPIGTTTSQVAVDEHGSRRVRMAG